jgi:hypothetical protein
VQRAVRGDPDASALPPWTLAMARLVDRERSLPSVDAFEVEDSCDAALAVLAGGVAVALAILVAMATTPAPEAASIGLAAAGGAALAMVDLSVVRLVARPRSPSALVGAGALVTVLAWLVVVGGVVVLCGIAVLWGARQPDLLPRLAALELALVGLVSPPVVLAWLTATRRASAERPPASHRFGDPLVVQRSGSRARPTTATPWAPGAFVLAWLGGMPLSETRRHRGLWPHHGLRGAVVAAAGLLSGLAGGGLVATSLSITPVVATLVGVLWACVATVHQRACLVSWWRWRCGGGRLDRVVAVATSAALGLAASAAAVSALGLSTWVLMPGVGPGREALLAVGSVSVVCLAPFLLSLVPVASAAARQDITTAHLRLVQRGGSTPTGAASERRVTGTVSVSASMRVASGGRRSSEEVPSDVRSAP